MRIKAITQGNASVSSMANGAGSLVATIPANTFVTLTQTKKDGGTTYYYTEEYEGYLKKSYVKLIRDEEFYYSSSLLKSKTNRSSASRLFQTKAELRKLVAADTPSTANTTKNQGTKVTNKQQSNSTTVSDSVIPAPNSTQTTQTQASVNATSFNKKGVNVGILAGVAVAGALLGGKNNSSPVSKIAGGLTSGFMSSGSSSSSFGSSGGLGGTSINSLIGSTNNSFVGGLLQGATISNVLNGSFWTSNFLNNITSVIGGYLRTLSQKLKYVIGFDLFGSLSNWLTGFGITYGNTGWSANEQSANTKFQYNNDSNLENRINEFFKYKGANYKMTTRTFPASAVLGNNMELKWEQDATYATGVMTAKQDEKEVEVHKTLYSNLYSDFSDSLEKARTGLNLNITKNDWYYNFNRYRLIHPDSLLGNTKGYIFFTRPDLNANNQEITSTDIGALFFNMSSQHPEIIGELTQGTNRYLTDHAFMPILCNRCTGIDIQDEQLETKEINETLTGWKLNYATNLIKSKSANTVMTSFIDDERLTIYLIFKLWCEYISAVSRGITDAKQEYINRRILDYANSIYYFLCGPDGESILFWSKYTGCIPTNIPSSNFSDNYADPIKMPRYSITWQYAFKKDYDPFSLAEFNYLCAGGNFKYVPIYSEETARSPVTISGAPYVDTSNAANLFKLKFRPRQY